jgi:hypothetical protein
VKVVRFNPETADVTELGASLEPWAQWLLADPDVNAAAAFAYAYQQHNGALEPRERLVPLQFFVAGGDYDFDNLAVKDAVIAMSIRGPIAQRIHNTPDGATFHLDLG